MAYLTLRPPNIEIRHTGTDKGRGVYTLRPLALGDHVETCPVILFATDDYDALPEEIRRRAFSWSALITKRVGQYALALGYGGVYNSANPANLKYSAMRSQQTLTFVAARAIAAGEELTINYDERNGFSPSADSEWMKRNNVKPV